MIATLPLKAKLAILSAIPLLCAIGFGTKLSFERVAELKEFRSFEKAMQLSVLLAEVNSINTAEQGSIWGFGESAIADNSAEVVREVQGKWEEDAQALDVAMGKVQTFLADMDLSIYGDSLRIAVDEVNAFYEKFPAHREDVRDGIDYGIGIGHYNDFKTKIQAVNPALLQETSDKDLSLKLSSYGMYVDYNYECMRYMGLMIWAHQTSSYPLDAYFDFEKQFARSQILMKHFRLNASEEILVQLDEILQSDRSVWVDEKVQSFLIANNGGQMHTFVQDKKLETDLKSKGEARNEELGAFQSVLRQEVLDYTANKINELASNRNLTFGATLFIFLFTVVVAVYIGRSITKALSEITQDIADEADRVFSAAKEIANSSETLAGNSCAQASSSEETNAMIETIRSNSKKAVEFAHAAGDSIRQTSSIILESNESMRDLNASIESISANSDETKKIMSSINDISFQTNILALNAAVEAARAGEAGAGFAIVADEVRNLAQRSAQASDNTSKLIESSNNSINSGLNCAGQTSEAFSKVKDSAEQVIARIVEIEAEMNKQVEAIVEISRAAEKMDQATQSNAASAEECAASSASLESHARGLEDQVEKLEAIVNGKANLGVRRNALVAAPIRSAPARVAQKVSTSDPWVTPTR